jgi:hypothetical protein
VVKGRVIKNVLNIHLKLSTKMVPNFKMRASLSCLVLNKYYEDSAQYLVHLQDFFGVP